MTVRKDLQLSAKQTFRVLLLKNFKLGHYPRHRPVQGISRLRGTGAGPL
jgi:hypothetical protein